ncbi:MAG TPA: hypothetical protein VHJ20_18255 [Polyangia bacterium]|nr:hypothetical protein [Polyangia bacterium]
MRARVFASCVAAALAVAAGIGWSGCFSPREPACPFACGPAGACPTDYVCASDGLCHRADGLGFCDVTTSDAGSDASDASAD